MLKFITIIALAIPASAACIDSVAVQKFLATIESAKCPDGYVKLIRPGTWEIACARDVLASRG